MALICILIKLDAGVLDFEEFLKLYKSCLSNAKVRSKYTEKLTVKYNKEGKAVLTVMTRTVSEAGAILQFVIAMALCCSGVISPCVVDGHIFKMC